MTHMPDEPMALILAGSMTSYCVPKVLYHGTWFEASEQILSMGLQYAKGQPQSMASQGANYLTTSLSMAASIARSRAIRYGSRPAVIAIDASKLNADWLSFDLNMCGQYWTESVAYTQEIPLDALRKIDHAVEDIPDELMLLGEPTPGKRPVVFMLDWPKAAEFLLSLGLTPCAKMHI